MSAKRRAQETCMYCGRAAASKEHIIATRFIDVLRDDPRGLPIPIMLNVTLPSGVKRRIGGKRTNRGQDTLEYTTKVCDRCNSGWMNDVDTAAYPYVAEMIRDNPVTLDPTAQRAVAAWICKIAVTARSEPHNPLPIHREWTDWLYAHHTALPNWYVWIGRYVGAEPWWYNPHDVRVELGLGSAAPPPGLDFVQSHGLLATLVIGYLILQVFGVGGSGSLVGPEEPSFPRIWPTQGTVTWPPPEHIDDAGLPLWAERLLQKPPTPGL
jgi:hypothetical protein